MWCARAVLRTNENENDRSTVHIYESPVRSAALVLGGMHPTLSLHNNPQCVEQILAFKRCHEEVGYWGRLTGACNEYKHQLDACFKAQKKVTRKGLLEKARAERERWHQACERENL